MPDPIYGDHRDLPTIYQRDRCPAAETTARIAHLVSTPADEDRLTRVDIVMAFTLGLMIGAAACAWTIACMTP